MTKAKQKPAKSERGPKQPICCGGCAAEIKVNPTSRGTLRLPRGWKRRPDPASGQEAVLCGGCWKKLYRLRSISFPVQGVHEGGSWRDFCAAVRQSLFRSRSLAQWAVNRLAATDVSRTLDTQKLPEHPPLGAEDKVYLYGLASREFADWGEWEGAYSCAQGVLRAAEMKYNPKRTGIIMNAEASVPTVRSCPYPVPAVNWSAEYVEHTNETTEQTTRMPAVNLPLLGRRWLVRLRGGRQRARQLAAFRQIVSGEAEQCELAIYRKRSQANRDRSGTVEKPAAGKKIKYDIMVKLVAWLPRETREGAKREGVLTVASTKRTFLTAVHPDFERPWLVNRNDYRSRIVSHTRRIQQISEDMKVETRPLVNPRGPWQKLTLEERKQRRQLKRQRKRRQGYLDEISRNYNLWSDSIVKEMASWLVQYADRIGVAKIHLDLSEMGYCPGFRWAALRERIKQNAMDLSPPIAVEVDGGDEGSEAESDNGNNGADGSDQTSAG